ncbi:hypothetical protein [Mesorhizobium sp. WSM3860]|uniref:hypothetical protein n=1 Tax=Mesorhizobium sp. WSM3860 TaxID=2029403 RepID=UPI00114101C9|nr:hypothetical protein [Mesorhizobium sp. WSM3860]
MANAAVAAAGRPRRPRPARRHGDRRQFELCGLHRQCGRSDPPARACTQIIEDKAERPDKRAIAYFKRAYAWAAKGDNNRAIADSDKAHKGDHHQAIVDYDRRSHSSEVRRFLWRPKRVVEG